MKMQTETTRRLAGSRRRPGAALIAMLVVLSTLTVMMTAITWQILAQSRYLDQREHQLQAHWLAQSGLELAAARLLKEPQEYTGETFEPIPQAQVVITVQQKQNHYHITSEARYPVDVANPVVRTAERAYRLVRVGDKTHLEFSPK